MTQRDPKLPREFDDLEPLPLEGELAELPDDVLEELPDSAVELSEMPDDVVEIAELPANAIVIEEIALDPITKSAPAPVPAVKPAPRPAAKPAPAPVAKTPPPAAAQPAPVQPVPVQPPPVSTLAPAPLEAEKVAPTPAASPSPAPAASTPVASEVAPKVADAAAVKASAAAVIAPVVASTGSRRERMEKDRETRSAKPKVNHWSRWAGPGEKPKREMEQAPALLRKAAVGLFIGCLLPWGGVTNDWMGNVVEKLLILAGLYVWHQSHLLRDGVQVPSFISSMGAKKFLPLFITAGVLALVGFSPILSSGSLFLADGSVDSSGFGPFAEKGFLLLAGLTITHIYDYQHGGRFNPMFPIMFLAPGIAGVMALLKVFSADPIHIGHIVGGLGAVLVSIAGWMSAYTMYVAMKEAKAHGDAKKAAQAEQRKSARADRKN